MSKVIAFNPPFNAFSGNHSDFDFPRGLISILSFLEDEHDVEYISLDHHKRSDPNFNLEQFVRNVIETEKPDVVLVCANYTIKYLNALRIIQTVKAHSPTTLTVTGGVHVSSLRETVFEDCPDLDVLVLGEGEWTTRELLQADKSELHKVSGILTRRNGRVIATPPRSPGLIDELPPINYKLLKEEISDLPIVQIVTQRGCAYRCKYCIEADFFGKKVRFSAIDRTIAELDDLRSNFTVKNVSFEDSMFNMRNSYFRQLFEEIATNKFNIAYINTRVDTVTPEGFELIRKAGLRRIWMAGESSSSSVLDIAHKRTTSSQIRDAFRMTKEADLVAATYWIVGLPGSNPSIEDETANFICRIMEEFNFHKQEIAVFVPYPGSPFHTERDKHGIKILNTNWNDWGRFGTQPVYELPGFSSSQIYQSWQDTIAKVVRMNEFLRTNVG